MAIQSNLPSSVDSVVNAILAKVNLGSIKSVQRGVTAGAGTVTITAVNIAKCNLDSKSKGSAGVVATNSVTPTSLMLTTTSPVRSVAWAENNNTTATGIAIKDTRSTSDLAVKGGSLSGGSTNLTTREYSAVLTNSTTITVDGPVEWELTEYN